MFRGILVAAIWTLAFSAVPAEARDQIRIVGSSTVYPFSAAVSEEFGHISAFKTPVVESNGTGRGFELFCGGIGAEYPDIADASRRISPDELASCRANGVTDIAEIEIGFDGIVLANAQNGPVFALSRRQLYLALARSVPENGRLVANPNRRWRDIDPALPDEEIVIYGPAPNHGTRDMLVELAMLPSCGGLAEIMAMSGEARRLACAAMREDGGFVEISGNYSVTLQKLSAHPRALGVLTYSYLDQNGGLIKAARIDGIEATTETIADGRYPLARPLYIYVKKAHLGMIPGLKEFLSFFASDRVWGPDGILAGKGLIVAPDPLRRSEAKKARDLPNMRL